MVLLLYSVLYFRRMQWLFDHCISTVTICICFNMHCHILVSGLMFAMTPCFCLDMFSLFRGFNNDLTTAYMLRSMREILFHEMDNTIDHLRFVKWMTQLSISWNGQISYPFHELVNLVSNFIKIYFTNESYIFVHDLVHFMKKDLTMSIFTKWTDGFFALMYFQRI